MSRFASTPNISNEHTAELPAIAFKGEIVVVDSEEQIEAACRDLASYPVIGFDTETRPSFKAGVSYRVSLLQLSTPTKCYLIRLNKVPLDREIMRIFENDKIQKVGADVGGDIRALNELRRFKDRGFVDLQSIAWEWGIAEKSLRKISAIVLGYRVSKAQRLSNWEAQTLTPQQQSYAATDAWVAIEILDELNRSDKLPKAEIAKRAAEMAAAKAEGARRKAERKAEGRRKHKVRRVKSTNEKGDISNE